MGPYEVLSALGAGGMGEVWRARDPRLGREVAIKVLPEEMARDAERVARFEREARALAALNHPNIATLLGFESDGDRRFLVMELVEGEDLSQRIAHGPIPVDEALPLFLQIAEGLEAAHEKGILHRDLKPANVKLGHDGRVKVLDFGLAKALLDEHGAASAAGSLGDFTHSPTLTAQATRAGTLLGTAAYMSPEQARGLPADPRADVWAFGCCFYEALTAKRPFAGDDVAQTLAAVLKDTPDWNGLPQDLPRHVAVLVRRCLEKNRRARVQSMGDVRVELQECLAPPSAIAPAAARESPERPRSPWARRSLWLAGLIATLVAGLAVARRGKPDASLSSPPTIRIPVALPDGAAIPYLGWGRLPPAISRDGRRIAYSISSEDGPEITLLDLETGVATRLPGTTGTSGPFFSPDGESLGYLNRADGGVRVASLSGGEPRRIATGRSSATWDDGWIYYVDDAGSISRVSADGNGSPQPVTRALPSEPHSNPQVLPGGGRILHSVFVSGQAHWSVAVTTIATGEQKVLFERGFAPRYLPTGHLLVAQEDVLLAMTLDLDTLTVGSPVAVLRGLLTSLGPGVAAYAVSDTGVLVHLTGALERDGWLVRLGPGVAPERLNKKPLDLEYGTGMALSPDGRRLAVARLENFDLWTFDLGTRDLDARVTTNVGGDYNPVWGPREGTLTFNSNQGGLRAIYSRRADGRGPVEPLLADRQALKGGPLSWSPDGTVLLVAQADPETKLDLWVVPAARSDAAQVFLRTEFNEGAAAFSPDGRWVAYASDETGRSEVYVTSYPDQDIKRRVSREGGASPRWSSDGRLFFAWETRVMQVEATDSRWTPSTPETFVDGVDGGEIFRNWDVAPDGRSVIALEQRRPIQLHMVQNWFAELERLVPTD